jgi:KinB signaling pathway activation protein
MNLKKLGFLFISTSLIGGISTILTAILMRYQGFVQAQEGIMELIAVWLWLFFVGWLFSIISQMGFFAYLMVHRFGLGLFKARLWQFIQLLLIAFVFFDLIYFRDLAFSDEGTGWWAYLTLPVVLLIAALITAALKAKATKTHTFVPALFFMFVVTTIELVPSIIQNDPNWIALMTTPMVLCNMWQMLILHKLNPTNMPKST